MKRVLWKVACSSLGIWLGACTPATPADHAGDDGKGASDPPAGACERPLPDEQPSFVDPPLLGEPSSHVEIEVVVPLELIRKELDRTIPVPLAGESGRSVGGMGKLSYSVRRSGLELRLTEAELLVDVLIAGHASVCVPLGFGCPSVGSCSPSLRSVARVPLGARPELGMRCAPGATVELLRGCAIGGVDATPQIQRQAQGYVGQFTNRIDAALAGLRPALETARDALGSPWRADQEAGCLAATGARVTHGAARPGPSALTFTVAVDGPVHAEQPCATQPAEHPTSSPAAAAPEPGSRLALSTQLRLDELASALDRSLGSERSARTAPGGLVVEKVTRVRAIAGDAGPRLALGVTLGGASCGELWLDGSAAVESKSGALRLRDVRVSAGQAQRARQLGPIELGAFGSWLAERLTAPLPAPPSYGLTAVRDALASLVRGRNLGAKITLSDAPASAAGDSVGGAPAQPTLALDPAGLRLTTEQTGLLRLELAP